MRCAKCGAENAAGKKFCSQCGSGLAISCPKCAAENAPGSRFCGDCGAALAGDAKPATGSPARSTTGTIHFEVEHSEALATDGERKTVTALFADIKGSTALEEDLDPEEARAIVDPALKLMIEAVRRYDGYIVQSTGDGIFALFGAPVAHEDHPQRALYAALRMQEELKRYSARLRELGKLPLEARVGANTGEVVVRSIATREGHVEYTPIGHTTNLASRMQALAPTGSIAVSEQTRKLVEGYFQLKALGPTTVKGVSEPVNIYEVTGLGPLRTRLQRSAGRGLTKFVGREREMDAMKHAAEQAVAGHGQIVAAVAEAGTGKSRLFFEFKAKNQSGWMVLETFSVSHGKASAYLPVLDLLHGYFRITSDDDARMRREKVNGRIVTLDPALEDTRPYVFGLLGIVEGDDPMAQMDAQIRKRRTLDAIKRILLRESLNQPLMVIFEDLHWIDEETQAFLNLLGDSIGTARLLMLVNYRPEYSHQWNSKTYYTQLRLDPLGQESAEEMLTALLGDGAEVSPLKQVIIRRSEGNPLFMEETYQVLLEEGALVRDGAAVRLTKALGELRIPPTVQAILAARIDRLAPDHKDLLQTLAVIGKEFSLSIAREVSGKRNDELNRMLDDLQLAEFIYEQAAAGDVEYTFKHALTQEVALGSVLNERRRLLHDRAGEAIEVLFAGHLDDHLTELAHHFTHGINAEKAVRYLTLAGRQLLERFAYAEARAQLQQGIELLKTLPESPERDARELELASALVVVLQITRSPAAPEAMKAAERARALAERSGNLRQLILQLSSIGLGLWIAGHLSKAAELADQMLDLAQREGSASSLLLAHISQLNVRFYRGDLVGAEEHFASLRQIPASVDDALLVNASIGLASIFAWTLGRAEKARERSAQGIALARDSKNPYILIVLRWLESWLYRFLREPQRAEAAAIQALTMSEEHGVSVMIETSRFLMGWARAQLGKPDEGVALIRQGVGAVAKGEQRLGITDFLTGMAEAQALAGMIDDALVTIDHAILANPEELVFRPNILTCRGELRLRVRQAELAEADFREAIAVAQKMKAKAFELRATTSLARLLRHTGRRDEARMMLAEIYGWFTEGFDTADLKDAKALLVELKS